MDRCWRAGADLGRLLVEERIACGERSPRRFEQRRENSANSSLACVSPTPVTHVYNPLEYARRAHNAYIRSYGDELKRVVFLGMNPGPFGMAQTGVPFGDIAYVRDWLGIDEPVGHPAIEHPKRPVQGFDCPRSEVSGSRLWGAIAEHYGRPERFFKSRFIANYCPLVFIESSGRNRTPDKLPASERGPLFSSCDAYLRRLVEIFEAEWVIGIGAFAEQARPRSPRRSRSTHRQDPASEPREPARPRRLVGKRPRGIGSNRALRPARRGLNDG